MQECLLECLKNKFKKERRPLTNLEEVAKMKLKYSCPCSGRKRKSEADDQVVSKKARQLVMQISYGIIDKFIVF